MAITIKINIDLKKQLKDARSASSKQIKKEIVAEVIKDYNKGISPINGFNSFVQYASSTAKKKGRRKPVTIKETGALHDSLTARQKADGVIEVFFKGKRNGKIASFIHFGTDFMDARPLLPTSGLEFKKRITDKFVKIIDSNIKKFFK